MLQLPNNQKLRQPDTKLVVPKTSPAAPQKPLFIGAEFGPMHARRDLIKLFDAEITAHVGPWAYQNGGAVIYDRYVRLNEHYSYYHGERELIRLKSEEIAQGIIHTKVAGIIGAGGSFEDKESFILRHLPDLEQIILIDVSAQFNQVAAQQASKFVKNLGRDIKVSCIDSDFFELDDLAMKALQSVSPLTLFTFGGLFLNPPGVFIDARPEGQLKKCFSKVSNLLDFGPNPHHNSLVMSHKLPPREISSAASEYEYVSPVKEDASITVEHWLAQCLSHMLNTADPEGKLNRALFPNGYTPDAVLQLFKHVHKYETMATNSRNGLSAKKDFVLQIYDVNGADIWTKEFEKNQAFFFFNSIFATTDWLDKMGRTCSHNRPLAIGDGVGDRVSRNDNSIVRMSIPQ